MPARGRDFAVRSNANPPESPAAANAGVYDSKFPRRRNKNPGAPGNLRVLVDMPSAGMHVTREVIGFPAIFIAFGIWSGTALSGSLERTC